MMSAKKDVKDERLGREHKRKSILLVASAMALVLMVSGLSMPFTAYAVTTRINPDPAITCGNQYWGIDNDNNMRYNSYLFGRNTSCSAVNPAWPSGTSTTNYARLDTQSNSTNTFAMQSAAQGNRLSPWDFQTPLPDKKPVFYPTTAADNAIGYGNPANPNHNYNFKVQWVWTRELLPNSNNLDNHMHAQMLMHLVMQSTTDSTKYITIDYILDNLVDTNNTWNQWAYSGDKDSTAWGQNSDDSKCEVIDGKKIYTMGIVLDNNSTTVNQWQNKVFNIGPSLTDATAGAFGSHYKIVVPGSGCTNDPGTIGEYRIKSMALVNEIFSDNGSYGQFRGGYSWGELYYDQ